MRELYYNGGVAECLSSYLNQVNAGNNVLDLTDQLCLGSGIELLELDAELGLLSNLLLLKIVHRNESIER